MNKAMTGVVAATVALMGTQAFGADMAVKMPSPAPAASFGWTGFYVGGNGGYGWRDAAVTYAPNDINALASTCGGGSCIPAASFNMNGALAGIQIGYNWPVSANWLLGLESDYDWSHIRGTGYSSFFLNSVGPSTFVATETIESFGTVRGRFGFLPTEAILIYGTGGLAYGRISGNATMAPGVGGLGSGNATGGFGYTCFTPVSCFAGSTAKMVAGWTLGTGGEFAISDHVTARIEYLYVNLGNGISVNSLATGNMIAPASSSFTASFSTAAFNIVRGGLNWKF